MSTLEQSETITEADLLAALNDYLDADALQQGDLTVRMIKDMALPRRISMDKARQIMRHWEEEGRGRLLLLKHGHLMVYRPNKA